MLKTLLNKVGFKAEPYTIASCRVGLTANYVDNMMASR